MNKKILVIDDDEDFLVTIKKFLTNYNADWIIDTACSASLAKELIQTNNYDTILLDIKMEGENGVSLLEKFKQLIPATPIIMVSGQSSISLAIDCIHKGALDYIEKPIDNNRLVISITKAIGLKEVLEGYNEYKEFNLQDLEIVGNSESIKKLKALIAKIAPTDLPILITGESGTGKELFAQVIHKLSKRANKDIVVVNSSQFPKDLIDNELFGHKKGTYSSAYFNQIGFFQKADGSTLFFDEIGDMPLEVQAKILRAIENQEIYRLGDPNPIKINVRVIAATNKDIKQLINEGRFREDLYHRISAFEIHIPPLRERVEDIPLLAKHFADLYVKRNNRNNVVIDDIVYHQLQNMSWEGNVRQLKNYIEKLIALSENDRIGMIDINRINLINSHYPISSTQQTINHLKNIIRELERDFFLKALQRNKRNINQTAKELKMDRGNLYKKLKELNIIE